MSFSGIMILSLKRKEDCYSSTQEDLKQRTRTHARTHAHTHTCTHTQTHTHRVALSLSHTQTHMSTESHKSYDAIVVEGGPFTFSHLADAFIQSDVQGRVQANITLAPLTSSTYL